ncbi:MAG: peptidylprolyl isomerase [Nitrospiraceae bacterium]|jgi:FKBP-type peptidyl-prolyl cis-trans isomerase 2|nr:peptidylprolyl isomerase [Nitrospiraceae bacterium]
MKKAGHGDQIKVHYTGTLDDGTVFDSSREREPLEFTIGNGQLIKDFETAIVGLTEGESTIIRIPADRAYGVYSEELLIEIPREHFPAEIDPQPGLALCMQRDTGEVLNVVVAKIADSVVTVDANHPLAGKDLTFVIEVVSIA